MPTTPTFQDVPEPDRRGPSARVPEGDAVELQRQYPSLYRQGQQAARAGQLFWDCPYEEPLCRYAYQAGWERP